MNIIKSGTTLEIRVYKKLTNTGLSSSFWQPCRPTLAKKTYYKLCWTRLRLSSIWKLFTDEWKALKLTFSNLHYPSKLIDSSINQFIANIVADNVPSDATDKSNGTLRMVMFSLPFIDQRTTEHTRRQNLCSKIGLSLHPVFGSNKGGNTSGNLRS